MISKKLIGGLISVTVVSVTYAIFNNFINLSNILPDSIKQNVVYTTPKEGIWSKNLVDKAVVSKSETKQIAKAADYSVGVSKPKVNSTQSNKPKLNKTIENKAANVEVATEKNVDTKDKPKDVIGSYSKNQAMLDINKYFGIPTDVNGNITNTDFNVKMVGQYEQFSWVSLKKLYSVIYNINNNETEGINYIPLDADYKDKTLLDFEQCNNSAKKFIMDNKVANIQNPKFILSENYKSEAYCSKFCYEDANDSSKKVNINVNIYTGEIMGFYMDSISDLKNQKDLGLLFYE